MKTEASRRFWRIERMAPAQSRELREIAIRRNQLAIIFDGQRGQPGVGDQIAPGIDRAETPCPLIMARSSAKIKFPIIEGGGYHVPNLPRPPNPLPPRRRAHSHKN